MPGATRRFFRFAFLVRFSLLLPTPLFFLLPGEEYVGSLRAWSLYGILLAWSAFLAYLTYHDDELMKRAWYVHLVDVVVVFVAFVATTHAGLGPSYSDVVIVGAFQLQTYGAIVTAAALAGVVIGTGLALLAAALYVGSLAIIGTPLAEIVDAAHIQGSVGRTLLYPATALIFGFFNVLVGGLVHARRRVAAAMRRQHEAVEQREQALSERTRALEQRAEALEQRAEAVQERAALEETSRFLRQLHQRGLGRLHLVRQTLEDMLGQIEERSRPRLEAVTSSLSSALDAIARETSPNLGNRQSESLVVVLRSVCETQRAYAWSESHPVVLRDEGVNDDERMLTPAEAEALRSIVGEALINACKHAHPGIVEIAATPTADDGCVITISDAGPKPHPGTGERLGRSQIDDRAHDHGWDWELLLGSGPNGSSQLRLVLPPTDTPTSPPRQWPDPATRAGSESATASSERM